jgi:hypothetical protein
MKTPANLAEMAHEETGQWLDSELLETWVFRRFQRLEQRIKMLEEEHEAKVIQNVQLMRERDAYRTAEEHQIALRQKIEKERDSLAAHVEQLTNIAEKVCTIAPEYLDNLGADAAFVIKSSPATSLARLIAESRIEGALAVRHLTQGDDWEDTELRAVIDDYVAGLRRQAEAPQ